MSALNFSSHLNASKWPSFRVGNCQFFSPNPAILARLRANPQARFWLDSYSEFACVIVDEQRGVISCIRDHFGLEPFFYSYAHGVLAFASNLPDLIASLATVPALNPRQIDRLLLSCCSAEVKYSDETCYQGIYRIEPGCRVEFYQNKITKVCYWDLSSKFMPILYSNPDDYLAHFSQLLTEGIRLQLDGATKAAVECSGGLDSSAVISGLRQLEVDQYLYMHIAAEGGQEVDDSSAARSLVSYYQLQNIQWLGADGFELEAVIRQVSQLFKGPPNFLFAIGANNIHQAVSQDNHRLLFSGFGGDECVSSHAPLLLCLNELLLAAKYGLAWDEMNAHYRVRNLPLPGRLRRILSLGSSVIPAPLRALLMPWRQDFLRGQTAWSNQEFEQSLLQGPFSHHLRMRIEDSAIIGKAQGFSYKYPLLYPKLVEFCHQLPLSYKRKNGVNRIMIKKYLAQYLPETIFANHHKRGGIMPAISDKICQLEQSGGLDGLFADLAYSRQAERYRNDRLKKDPESLSYAKILQSVQLSALKFGQE